jgi:hypothetical protein
VPPVVFADLSTTIAALHDGDVPDGAKAKLQQAQDDAAAGAETLEAYALSDEVRDIGMSEGQVSWFLNSQIRIVQALELYGQAASTAALALEAEGDQRVAIADAAAATQDSASEILEDGWSDYQNALGSVQIFDSPLTSLTGPTGA